MLSNKMVFTMKKISHWSWIGYIIGVAFALLSSIRYFLLYPDLDRALVYVGIGFIICALAFVYNKLLEHSNEIEAMSEYLADRRKK